MSMALDANDRSRYYAEPAHRLVNLNSFLYRAGHSHLDRGQPSRIEEFGVRGRVSILNCLGTYMRN